MNGSGRSLVAHRICEGAPHPPTTSRAEDLLKQHYDKQDGKPLQVAVASGPFTSSDNLEYEPLIDLVTQMSAQKPDVLVLTGPFVDMRHKAVASGRTCLTYQAEDGKPEEVLVSYDALFLNKVTALLEEFFAQEDNKTQVVLVPSLDDATTDWVYPQAPFTDRRPLSDTTITIPGSEGIDVGTLGLGGLNTRGRRRVHTVSNPCTFKINEVVFGVTATDVLFHMSAEETNGNLQPGTRLARIAQHMLQQRSYYPLFPAPPMANLDLNHADKWEMPCRPDVLIVPSRLAPFCRPVLDNSTIAVNPGLLTRDTTGGTYAIMDIHPLPRESIETSGVEHSHRLVDRSHLEIKKI